MNFQGQPPKDAKPWLLAIVLVLLSSSIHWGQVEFRAIGGPGIDRGEVVLTHANGAYLLGSTQPEDADLLRPYIVHYNNNLTVGWSVVLTSPDALEWIVDGRLDTLDHAQILTQRLKPDGTYAAAVHTLSNEGEPGSILLLDGIAPNFIPAKLCEWQGQMWVVGQSGNRLVAADLTLSNVLEWGGSVGQEDLLDVRHDNILIVVGDASKMACPKQRLGCIPWGNVLKSSPSKQVGPKVASMALTFATTAFACCAPSASRTTMALN